MSEIAMAEVAAQIGLPEIADIDPAEAARSFVPASIVGLSDGDLIGAHTPHSDSEKIRLYGETVFNEGEVAKRVLATALANGLEQTPIYSFQRFAADYYSDPRGPFSHNVTPATHVYPEFVSIDGNPFFLPRVPRSVIDYGACLTSRGLILDQLGFMHGDKKHTPFVYTPLTRLHFTNQALLHTYETVLGPGAANLMADRRFYIGREDGIASGSDATIQAQKDVGRSPEVADIIICNGDQHTTADDLERGATNAYTLLHEDGVFIVRGLGKPAESEVGTDQIADWAREAGFLDEATFETEVNPHTWTEAQSSKFTARVMKTVVLSKK
jgi:hypothetical protein